MKISNIGKLNPKVKCSYCNCEYEFDANDIKKEYSIDYEMMQYKPNQYDFRRRYVECPICKEKVYIDELVKVDLNTMKR